MQKNRLGRVAAALAALVVALSLAGAAAAADRQMELKAREAFAAGRFPEALDLFAKLYAETLHPVYLRNIGRCHQKMREPQKAIDAFKDYLDKANAKDVKPDERKQIEGYIAEMEALRDEQARAAAAAAAPPPPPPVTAPPPAAPSPPPPAPAAVTLTQPASPPAAEDNPFYTRWWFWTAVGVAVAGGVTAALLLSGGTDRPTCTVSRCQ